MIEMHDKFPPVSEKQVAELEKRLRRQLPPQYRQFLLLTNGGRPQNGVFTISSSEGDDTANFFYGILGADNCYDLLETRDIFKGRIPKKLLAIADDPGGNQICISLSPDDYGKIYFWDHELEFTPNQAITLVSDSFGAFINSLREEDE